MPRPTQAPTERRLLCVGAPGCRVSAEQSLVFLGETCCPRHALVKCAEALAMHRRLSAPELLECVDILGGALTGALARLKVLGFAPHPAVDSLPVQPHGGHL